MAAALPKILNLWPAVDALKVFNTNCYGWLYAVPYSFKGMSELV